MLKGLDYEILSFFGFNDSDFTKIQNDPALQMIYKIIIVPRVQFKKSMLSDLDEQIIYSTYKFLKKTIDTKEMLKILVLQMKTSSTKTVTSPILDKTKRIKQLIQSSNDLNKDIESKYLNLLSEIDKFIKSSTTMKQESKDKYKSALMAKYESVKQAKKVLINQIVNILLPIFEHSELLGDAVLAKMVEQKLKSIKIKNKTNYYNKCSDALKRFLNSNVFLYHILGEIDFRIVDLIPDVKKGQLRLAKRKIPGVKNEILNSSCIDFKYTSNLFEQLIGYLFIMKGYTYTYKVFEQMLEFIEFDPEDFLKYCMTNYGTPYPKIKLKPGCSCVDRQSKVSKCDNPGLFEPQNFLNLDCPTKCKIGQEFTITELTGSIDSLVQLLNQLSYDEILQIIYEITTLDNVDDWINVLEGQIVPALIVYFEFKKSGLHGRYFEPLENIYFQYMISKEDNENEDENNLSELLNYGIQKGNRTNLGTILGLYYLIKIISPKSKKVKTYLNELIKKDFFRYQTQIQSVKEYFSQNDPQLVEKIKQISDTKKRSRSRVRSGSRSPRRKSKSPSMSPQGKKAAEILSKLKK